MLIVLFTSEIGTTSLQGTNLLYSPMFGGSIIYSRTSQTRVSHQPSGSNAHSVSRPQYAKCLMQKQSVVSFSTPLYSALISVLRRSCSSYSFSSVPRSQSYSNPLPQSAVRKQQLLAVRTLFQKAYRTAVPELQPATQGGAMAIASGFLSRLPLFGTSSTSNTEV